MSEAAVATLIGVAFCVSAVVLLVAVRVNARGRSRERRLHCVRHAFLADLHNLRKPLDRMRELTTMLEGAGSSRREDEILQALMLEIEISSEIVEDALSFRHADRTVATH